MESFGETMLRLMRDRGFSLRGLAKVVPCDPGLLSRVSRGLAPPSLKLAEALEVALDASGELISLVPPSPRSVKGIEVPTHAKDDDVRRRAALELFAGLGVAAGALVATGEPVRQLLALTLASEPRDIEDWHITCADHLHAIRTRPPAQVRDGLVVDLLAIARQLENSDARTAVELWRVTAVLSVLHANALTRLGDHGSAIHWFRTARSAADASGDLELRLMIRGEEAGFGLYGQRDPQTVLTLLDRAAMIGGGARTFWLADQAGTRAKALALLHRHHEAARALNNLVDLAAIEAPGSGNLIPAFWRTDKIHFAESWVHAHAGNQVQADEARDRVLSYGPSDYQYAANVRLHEGLCTVINGGIDTGARQAVEILAALPATQHSQMITETGHAVLRAVPLDKWDRPAVRDLRALTSGGRVAQR